MRVLVVAALIACAAPPPTPAPEAPFELPADQVRQFTIWLGGARVGTAVETEAWSRAGVTLRRVETLRFLRGDAEVALETTIVVVADHALVPSRVSWRERGQGDREGEARRGDAWVIGERRLPADAVPAELVPLVIRREGRFEGRVFLPARGFVAGAGRVESVAPARLVARLAFDGAIAEATIDLARDGTYARVVDGEGVIAMRATPGQAAAPFEPVDLIAATAIPIDGAPTGTLLIDGDVALPAVPGQAAQAADAGIALALSPHFPGDLPPELDGADRTREIKAVVAAVRARITPDLAAGPSVDAAATATAGDCTTFALAYAAQAARRAIPTRVVTGLRVDGDRLVRHRWAVSWTGRAWIAIDAAYGAVPAGGDLVGLAVHEADDAGLVAGEAALAQVRAASWR